MGEKFIMKQMSPDVNTENTGGDLKKVEANPEVSLEKSKTDLIEIYAEKYSKLEESFKLNEEIENLENEINITLKTLKSDTELYERFDKNSDKFDKDEYEKAFGSEETKINDLKEKLTLLKKESSSQTLKKALNKAYKAEQPGLIESIKGSNSSELQPGDFFEGSYFYKPNFKSFISDTNKIKPYLIDQIENKGEVYGVLLKDLMKENMFEYLKSSEEKVGPNDTPFKSLSPIEWQYYIHTGVETKFLKPKVEEINTKAEANKILNEKINLFLNQVEEVLNQAKSDPIQFLLDNPNTDRSAVKGEIERYYKNDVNAAKKDLSEKSISEFLQNEVFTLKFFDMDDYSIRNTGMNNNFTLEGTRLFGYKKRNEFGNKRSELGNQINELENQIRVLSPLKFMTKRDLEKSQQSKKIQLGKYEVIGSIMSTLEFDINSKVKEFFSGNSKDSISGSVRDIHTPKGIWSKIMTDFIWENGKKKEEITVADFMDVLRTKILPQTEKDGTIKEEDKELIKKLEKYSQEFITANVNLSQKVKK